LIKVCPECSSAKVDTPALYAGDSPVKCWQCDWEGTYRELMEMPGTDRMNPVEIVEAVQQQLMINLAKHISAPMGIAMRDCGLIGAKDAKIMARLLKAGVIGCMTGITDEISRIQEELTGVGN
jgi:hypothetical protein